MAKDIQDRVGQILESDTARHIVGAAVDEALKGLSKARTSGARLGRKSPGGVRGAVSGVKKTLPGGSDGGGMSGMRTLAAGAGAAALAPVAAKGIGKLIKGGGGGALVGGPKKVAEGAASKLGDTVSNKVTGKIDEAGGPSGILKDAAKSALPFGGGDDDDGGRGKGGVPGVGKGRRMPIQQSVDVAVPLETAYNQWTQFEEWPNFMHRVTRVTQEDPCEVSFATKIWGKKKEFKANIETQRPDERIKWTVSEGITHTGLVTFHELGPRLTRIELGLDVEPGGLLEKAARGMRHIKRAARADLHRFKAFIEMLEHETGAWRGVIEDGKVVKDHDAGYDRKREYGSIDDLTSDSEGRNGGDPSRSSSRGRSSGGSSSRRSSASRSRSSSRSKSSNGSSRSGSKATSGRGSSSGRKSSSSGRGSSSSGRGSSSSGRGGSSRASGGRSSSASSRSSASRSRSGNSGGSGSRASSSSGSRSSGSSGSRSRSSSSNGSGSKRSSGSRSSSGSHEGRRRTASARRS